MAGGVEQPLYLPEEIPDPDPLYRWVPREFQHKGRLNPGAFGRDIETIEGISVDWSGHSTPQETKDRFGQKMSDYDPNDVGIAQVIAGEVRAIDIGIDTVTVRHVPLNDNRAHSLIKGGGARDTTLRRNLARIATWALPLPLEDST